MYIKNINLPIKYILESKNLLTAVFLILKEKYYITQGKKNILTHTKSIFATYMTKKLFSVFSLERNPFTGPLS